MARALFLSLPLHGHINPSLPLVCALVERGDEVVYVSTDGFATHIEQAGARYRPYRAPLLSDLRQMADRTDRMSWTLTRAVEEVLVHDLDALRAERPDYVISDSVAPWGAWVAQILDRPLVTSITTVAVNRHVMAFAAAHGTRPKSVRLALSKVRHVVKASMLGRRLRRQYGVHGTSIVGLMFGSSALNIVYTSRLFQPCAETFDDRFLFIGPSIGQRIAPEGVAALDMQTDGLIYISLGTLFNADASFYRTCFEAFGGDSRPVVLSVGTAVTEATLGVPPPNIVVKPWVPQLAVLPHASVFVSHGGMNSVSESLHHGVPLVLVPQMGEQEMVARRVEQLGAGVVLRKEGVTAATLRSAVDRVAGDSSFRRQAALVRRSFAESGGAERGAEAIVAYARAIGSRK